MYSSTLSLTSELDEVAGQRHAPADLPPGRPDTHCIGAWVGCRTGKENLAHAGIRSPDRPARSQSLYRLSYRGPRCLTFPKRYRALIFSGQTFQEESFLEFLNL
jgi:hypothetical protein